MESYDYPIKHFKLMAEMSSRLKTLSAQILEHEYMYHAFGSWLFIYERGGKKFRIVLDGRDDFLYLQKAAAEFDSGIENSAKWVTEWEDAAYKTMDDTSIESLVREVSSLIENYRE